MFHSLFVVFFVCFLFFWWGVVFGFFFQFSCRVLVLISLFAFFQFYRDVSRNGKVHYSADSFVFIFLTITRSDRLSEIRGYVLLFISSGIIIIIIIIIEKSITANKTYVKWRLCGQHFKALSNTSSYIYLERERETERERERDTYE